MFIQRTLKLMPNFGSICGTEKRTCDQYAASIDLEKQAESRLSMHDNRGQKDSEPEKTLVMASIVFYMTVSTALLLVNKVVLLCVALPVTFLWIQLLTAVFLLHWAHFLGWITLPRITWEVSRKLWSLIGINVFGLALNTYTIHHGDASFYQVARGLVLPLTILLTWIFLKAPSLLVLLACGIVTGGYFIGTIMESSDVHIPMRAIFYGLLSSFTTALHAIIIKKNVNAAEFGTTDLVYYNNAMSAIVLPFLVAMNGEMAAWHGAFIEATGTREEWMQMSKFIVGCLFTGVLGFGLNMASFFQMKLMSPVSHVICSAARGVLQTALAAVLFNDTVTVARASSIAVIILGSGLYGWVRNHEIAKENKVVK